MQAINAIYDGVNFKADQPIPVKGQYKVVITFLEPLEKDIERQTKKRHRPRSQWRFFYAIQSKTKISSKETLARY